MFTAMKNINSNFCLVSAIQTFAECEEYVDVVIVCREKKLKAHSLLLAAVSPFVKSLLESHFCECDCREDIVILLPDVRYNIMHLLLGFLYKGCAQLDEKELKEFDEVVKMFQIDIDKLTSGNHPFKEKPRISINPKYQTLPAPNDWQVTQSSSVICDNIIIPDQVPQDLSIGKNTEEMDKTTVTIKTETIDSFPPSPSLNGEVDISEESGDSLDAADYCFPANVYPTAIIQSEGIAPNLLPSTSDTGLGGDDIKTEVQQEDDVTDVVLKIDKIKKEIREEEEVTDVIMKMECDQQLLEQEYRRELDESKDGSIVREEPERTVILTYFHKTIQMQIRPFKIDCLQCISAHPKELLNITWSRIATTVRNEIRKLQRRQGKKKSSNGYLDRRKKLNNSLSSVWIKTEPARSIILHYFHNYICAKRIPTREECKWCIMEYVQVLRNKSWKKVKSTVCREISRLKYHEAKLKVSGQSEKKQKNVLSPEAYRVIRDEPAKSLVLDYFKRSIQNSRRTPSKDECLACIHAHPEALKNIYWERVNRTVRNEIGRLKRERSKKNMEARLQREEQIFRRAIEESKKVLSLEPRAVEQFIENCYQEEANNPQTCMDPTEEFFEQGLWQGVEKNNLGESYQSNKNTGNSLTMKVECNQVQ